MRPYNETAGASTLLQGLAGNRDELNRAIRGLLTEEERSQNYAAFNLRVANLPKRGPRPWGGYEPKRPVAPTTLRAEPPYTSDLRILTSACQPVWLEHGGIDDPPPYTVYTSVSPEAGVLEAGVGLGAPGTGALYYPKKGDKPDTSVDFYEARAGFFHEFLFMPHRHDSLVLVDASITVKRPTSSLITPSRVCADAAVIVIAGPNVMRGSVQIFSSESTSRGLAESFTPQSILTTAHILPKDVSQLFVGVQLVLGVQRFVESDSGYAAIELTTGWPKVIPDLAWGTGQSMGHAVEPLVGDEYLRVNSISCRLYPQTA